MYVSAVEFAEFWKLVHEHPKAELSAAEKHYLCVLMSLSKDGTRCFKSQAEVARAMSVTDRSIRTYRDSLEAKDAIKIHSEPGHTDVITILLGSECTLEQSSGTPEEFSNNYCEVVSQDENSKKKPSRYRTPENSSGVPEDSSGAVQDDMNSETSQRITSVIRDRISPAVPPSPSAPRLDPADDPLLRRANGLQRHYAKEMTARGLKAACWEVENSVSADWAPAFREIALRASGLYDAVLEDAIGIVLDHASETELRGLAGKDGPLGLFDRVEVEGLRLSAEAETDAPAGPREPTTANGSPDRLQALRAGIEKGRQGCPSPTGRAWEDRSTARRSRPSLADVIAA